MEVILIQYSIMGIYMHMVMYSTIIFFLSSLLIFNIFTDKKGIDGISKIADKDSKFDPFILLILPYINVFFSVLTAIAAFMVCLDAMGKTKFDLLNKFDDKDDNYK